MSAVAQLPLPFAHAPTYAARDFLRTPCNEAALAWLGRPSDWPDGRLIVWGEAGSGKTHLLHVWASQTGARLSPGAGLEWFAALAGGGAVGVDDAAAAPEAELLHLMNAAAEWRRPLVLASRAAPAVWAARLPDLSSRLRAAAAVELRAPEDDLLAPLFARLLADRQLVVPAPVQAWLLRRLPRHPRALGEAAEQLDQALLASGGRVTRTVAVQIVGAVS